MMIVLRGAVPSLEATLSTWIEVEGEDFSPLLLFACLVLVIYIHFPPIFL